MDTPSPWSTIEGTSPRVSIVDRATPCSTKNFSGLRVSCCSLKFSGFRSTGIARLRAIFLLSWMAMLVAGGIWWMKDDEKEYRLFEHDLSLPRKLLALDGLQFLESTHPSIRYVGRWTSTPDRTQKDGSFPGVYFEFAFNGSDTVLLSLHNTDSRGPSPTTNAAPDLAFLPITNISHAEPISLLARIDEDEYIILPNASSIVLIRKGNLDLHSRHEVRIIAPMVGRGAETLQIEGLWIEEDGQLLPFEDISVRSNPDLQGAAEPTRAGASHKMLEIVTDLPGSMAGRDKRQYSGSSRDVLGGVMGWEYLLGDMFGVDHVMIGMDGMCLIQECIGGNGSPAGLADVFFQSGPLGTVQYTQPWLFESYLPEVMVMNIGNSDWESFQMHSDGYNKTLWELSMLFEDTYVSLIRAIRTLAYPTYSPSDPFQRTAATLPIFIMRPLRGQLEQVTLSVVDRLQSEGDQSVFWLDTSGWLNTNIDFDGPAAEQDFFLDEVGPSKQWRLTERGNQRVAILLHMHVCRYLAKDPEKCAFLPAEIYQGSINSDKLALKELQDEGDDDSRS